MSLAPARFFVFRAVSSTPLRAGRNLVAAARPARDDSARTTTAAACYSASRSSRSASTSTGSTGRDPSSKASRRTSPPSPGSSTSTSSKVASTSRSSQSARRTVWPEASPSRPSSASDSQLAVATGRSTGRELEVQDQVLFALSEQVGGRFGNAVKIVDLAARVGLQTSKVLGKDMRAKLIRGLMTAGVRHVEAGAILDHRLVPQLEETTDVLIKVANLDSKFHLPVYCPDLAALQTLCEGIQWDEHERNDWVKGEILCDEISIIVGCSETYSVANFAMTIREHLEALRPLVAEARKLGFRVRGHLHCAIECPFEGPIPSLRVADLAQELEEMGCYEIALGDTTGRGDPRSVRALVEDVAVRIGVERISGQFHDTFGTGISNVLTALSLGVRTFDTCAAGLASCPYSPESISAVPTEDVIYTLHNLGYTTGVNLIELAKTGAWVSYMVDQKAGSRSRAGQAILARIKWEELSEVKQMRRDRVVSWAEWVRENQVVSLCFAATAFGAVFYWNYKKVLEHPAVVERKLQDRLAVDMIDQALRKMEQEESERYDRRV